MALLPPHLLDSVVALGVGDAPDKRRWIGTAFLYGEKEPGTENSYYVFLVTNKHVLNGHKKVWVKFNTVALAGSRDFSLTLVHRNGKEAWIRHSKDQVDLGAIFVNAKMLQSQNMRFTFFRRDKDAYTISQMKEEGVTEGDGVYVLGYPMGMVDVQFQSVICRGGYIARLQDVLHAGAGSFLVDVAVFPGNSGGPVVLRPEITSIVGTKPTREARLVGVVQSSLNYQDTAFSKQTGQPRVSFVENAGLGSIVPVDRVNELMKTSMKRVKGRLARARWKAKQSRETSTSKSR